jgi:hypothetical protein
MGLILLQIGLNATILSFSVQDKAYGLTVCYGVLLLFGFWTLYLWISAWCTDPGMITIYDTTETVEAQLDYCSFSSEEEKVIETDKIYKRS